MVNSRGSFFAKIAAGKFTYLLTSMGLLLVLSPFLSGILWAEVATDVIFTALLFSAICAVHREGPLFMIQLILAVLTVSLRWWYQLTYEPTISLWASVTGAVFFVLIAVSIITFVFKVTGVTVDTIAGSICAYLLLGIAWSHIFALLQHLNPQTLNIAIEPRGASDLEPFLYFSFVTLTTLGYGDLVPGTAPAQFLAVFEAVIGQIYLTVLVARLVGLYGRVPATDKNP